jgi:hypothetical protein
MLVGLAVKELMLGAGSWTFEPPPQPVRPATAMLIAAVHEATTRRLFMRNSSANDLWYFFAFP